MTVHNCGSLNIDDVFRTPHIVRPGETIPSWKLERFAGGKGLNQSIALARAGATVRHIGRIGKDGVFLCDVLAQTGADTTGIIVTEDPTGRAIIQVADDGENAIVLYSGANQGWDESDIERMIHGAKKGDILLLQNEITMIPEIMDAAYSRGLRIAFNPAPMRPDIINYGLERLSWLVVNETEGRELVGLGSDKSVSELSDEELVTELGLLCPDTVVVLTLGKKGAVCLDESGLTKASFPDQGLVIDTTGAGDTFMGYFIAAELEGLNLKLGLRRACAAGAIAVTRAGATSGIPFRQEVDGLFREI